MSVPTTMTAIEIAEAGGPEVLRPTERPVPAPGPGELLIAVAAAGVNRPDIAQRNGSYPPPPGASDLPGLEVAGTVAAIGADAAGWTVGDAVCALTSGGGYAEYVAVPATQALPVPDSLDMIQAAALPETFFTVWTNVFDRARLATGETFLVHGGSSGIGTTAIQLACAFDARVFTTVGSAQKAKACLALGAELAVNYRDEDFVEAVRGATDGQGVDVILDMVGGDYLPRNIRCLKPDGRLVQIALMRGARAELDLARVMTRRLTVTGSTLRPQSIAAKAAIAAALRTRIWPLIAAGEIAPVIHATFDLKDAAKAHELMEAGTHIGKIVLKI
jgi:putative PIG3 family NAD(P)H quinone oxidoreductase